MCEYIDDNDNMLYHVLFSFFQFLDAVYCFHKYEDKHIKNIALDSMYVHIRGISDFFSSRSCYQDDLKYNDFIDATIETNELPEDVREYINKTTAHISKKASKMSLDNQAFFDEIKEIVLPKNRFACFCHPEIQVQYQHTLSILQVIVVCSYMFPYCFFLIIA